MNSVETTDRTVEGAVKKALSALGIRENNAVIEVISEPAQGLFSLLSSRVARVKVKPRYEAAEYLENFLSVIVERTGLNADIAVGRRQDPGL